MFLNLTCRNAGKIFIITYKKRLATIIIIVQRQVSPVEIAYLNCNTSMLWYVKSDSLLQPMEHDIIITHLSSLPNHTSYSVSARWYCKHTVQTTYSKILQSISNTFIHVINTIEYLRFYQKHIYLYSHVCGFFTSTATITEILLNVALNTISLFTSIF